MSKKWVSNRHCLWVMVDWTGQSLDCYDYLSTCCAKIVFFETFRNGIFCIIIDFPLSSLNLLRFNQGKFFCVTMCTSYLSKLCNMLSNKFQLRYVQLFLGKYSPQKIWKYLMAFAMKGGGGLACHSVFFLQKMIFRKNHLESFPDCQNVFCI